MRLFCKADGNLDKVALATLALALVLLLTLVLVLLRRQGSPLEVAQPAPSYLDLQGKHWLAYGDSITKDGYWQPVVLAELVADNLQYTDAGIGGSCVAGFAPNGFWQAERLEGIKQANPDIVTILGGTNDFFSAIPIGGAEQFAKPIVSKDVDTFIGAYSYVIESLREWKPSLHLLIMTTPPAYPFVDGSDPSGSGLSVADYVQAELQIAAHYKIPVVDLYNDLNPKLQLGEANFFDFFYDGIHPGTPYANAMAELVLAQLRKLE